MIKTTALWGGGTGPTPGEEQAKWITKLVREDLASQQRKNMEDGERYYCFAQDVMTKDFRRSRLSETQEDDQTERLEVFINPNRSNHHVVNGFHRLLVDQKVSYLLGRKPVIGTRERNRDYGRLLEEWAGERFQTLFQELLTGASNKGYECLHFYYDKRGKLQATLLPAEGVIPIYVSGEEGTLAAVVRYYEDETQTGERIHRAEWWSGAYVAYYKGKESRFFLEEREDNPAPHWWKIGKRGREKGAWGRPPFVVLKNNRQGRTDLEGIKGLIDAYDLISSEGVNTLLDLVDLYWVIQGYGGETAAAITRKLQINKAVHISDANGSVEAKQTELSMAGRLDFLKMLRRDIFQFGQGVDIDVDRMGNSPSGVSLQYQYTLLDLKADGIAAQLKEAMREYFGFLTEDYNRKYKTRFQAEEIRIELRKNRITNDFETVEMISMSKDLLGRKTLISKHPFVEEVNAEEELREREKEEAHEAKHSMERGAGKGTSNCGKGTGEPTERGGDKTSF